MHLPHPHHAPFTFSLSSPPPSPSLFSSHCRFYDFFLFCVKRLYWIDFDERQAEAVKLKQDKEDAQRTLDDAKQLLAPLKEKVIQKTPNKTLIPK
jgi:hypothetical protein